MESDDIYHDSEDIDNYKQNKKSMDVRTITVAKVEFQREFKPAGKTFTVYYFNLESEDGLQAQFSSNVQNQMKFLIGNTYEVNVETKSNSRGTYLFIDYSDAEKEKKKEGSLGQGSGKAKWSPYQRSRAESMSIIAQSSYEAAASVCVKIKPDSIDTHELVSAVAKKFAEFIVDQSGFNSTECKNEIKEFIKAANEKSIVYQKALKCAVIMLDLRLIEKKMGDPSNVRNTQGMISLTELIVEDINRISSGL